VHTTSPKTPSPLQDLRRFTNEGVPGESGRRRPAAVGLLQGVREERAGPPRGENKACPPRRLVTEPLPWWHCLCAEVFLAVCAWDSRQTRALEGWVAVGFWWLGYVGMWGEICGLGGTA
jgi:hypothetical protein